MTTSKCAFHDLRSLLPMIGSFFLIGCTELQYVSVGPTVHWPSMCRESVAGTVQINDNVMHWHRTGWQVGNRFVWSTDVAAKSSAFLGMHGVDRSYTLTFFPTSGSRLQWVDSKIHVFVLAGEPIIGIFERRPARLTPAEYVEGTCDSLMERWSSQWLGSGLGMRFAVRGTEDLRSGWYVFSPDLDYAPTELRFVDGRVTVVDPTSKCQITIEQVEGGGWTSRVMAVRD